MSHFLLDTSAIVKRYALEVGSRWILELVNPAAAHTIALAEITLAEVAAALAAKHRAPGGITEAERDQALAIFLHHCRTEYGLLATTRLIIDRAVALTQRHRLRGYHAVQLATALVANEALTAGGLAALTFVAADDDILAAARSEGLSTENPNHHP